MSYYTFKISWPDRLLWPNGPTGNRFAVSRARGKAKAEAFYAAKGAKVPKAERAHIHVTWHPNAMGPMPDEDNCIASFKAAQDGIANALGMDDRNITTSYRVADERRACVIVNVSTDESADEPLKGGA